MSFQGTLFHFKTIMIKNINYYKVQKFVFENNTNVQEYHLMIEITNNTLAYQEQLHYIFEALKNFLSENSSNTIPVFARFFLSDAKNQISTLQEKAREYLPCAISYIQQPPANNTKIALWVYFISNIKEVQSTTDFCKIIHNGCKHIFTTNRHDSGKNSKIQTENILQNYIHSIRKEGCSLKDNCIRTWFYIHDIDNNYKGMVKGRNKIFDIENLVDDTHFIASTGIGGRSFNSHHLIQLDAYTIKGLKQDQIKYLYALHYMNRTSEYHVRFERGTLIDYGDRRHAFISGTASINNQGNVVYPDHIIQQTQRMWTNTEALLQEADMTFENVCAVIVYLRDRADYEIVNTLFEKKFPHTPYIIVNASVCRPEWLIEMECIGIKKQDKPDFNIF